MNKKREYALIIGVLATIFGMIYMSKLIFPTNFIQERIYKGLSYESAQVVSIEKDKLQEDHKLEYIEVGYQDIELKIVEGKYKNQTFQVRNAVSRLYNTKVKVGTKVVAMLHEEDGELQGIDVYTYKRNHVVIGLIFIFCFLIIFVGKMKGLKSVLALFFTLTTILYLMVPMLFRGVSPVLAATITSLIVTVVTMYLLNGKTKKTLVATIGTVSGVVIAGTVAIIAGEMAHLSGLTMQDAEPLLYIAEQSSLQVKGLFFAGILIASLGAVMDIAMSIASAIYEVHLIDPKLCTKELYKVGMNIGQDIIGTMSNTLILAFAGGSLGIMIMLTSANLPSIQLNNLDILAMEIIQGISGTIGIILSVPITSIVSAVIYKGK
ncbi:MAG TPA: YibE/F family protein [Epulopiscium sp.]|nr:YibE/F family protein [Candidatus Epulonipiscium sp.]